MLSHETKITYDNVDTYILEKIPGFSEFFYKIYDNSDRELKYEVFGSLTDFFKQNYQSNSEVVETIVDILQEIFLTNDKKLQELILTGFIENLLEENKKKMGELRSRLKYKEFQEDLDELYKFWYKREL